MDWKWAVAALCVVLTISALAYMAKRNYSRLRYALLSDSQKKRLKGLNRQAMAQMMADQEARLKQAADSQRQACVQAWSQKIEGGASLSGILIASWDTWSVEDRKEFCEARQLEVTQAAEEVLGTARTLEEDWVKGCMHDFWVDLPACCDRKARSKGGWIEILEVVLKGKVNDPKRIARCKIDSMLKAWAKTQSTKPNTELRRRWMLGFRAWLASELLYSTIRPFVTQDDIQ